MTQTYEGDITLTLGIDTTEAREEAIESAKDIQNRMNEVLTNAQGIRNQRVQVDKLNVRLDDAIRRAEEIGATPVRNPVWEQYANQVTRYTQELEQAQQARQELFQHNFDPESQQLLLIGDQIQQWEDLNDTIVRVQNAIRYYTNLLDDMARRGQGEFIEGTDTQEYADAVRRVSTAANDARMALERLSESTSDTDHAFENIVPSLKSTSSLLMRIGSRIIRQGTRRLGDTFKQMGDAAESSQKKMKRFFHNLLRYGLGVRSLYFLFKKIRTAINDTFDELAEFSGAVNSVNADIVSFRNSLSGLKSAWGAAFGQALSFVLPILNTIIGALTRAGNALAGFFSLLTGKKIFMAVSSGQGKVGGSAKKATEALEDEEEQAEKTKDRLAGFDDLDVLGVDEDESPLDGLEEDLDDLGDGGGGAIESAFEELPVDDWIKDLWERILKAWQDGADAMYDLFYEFGRIIGDKMLQALTELNGKWPAIQEAARKIAAAIAGFLNGYFETPGLAIEIGKTIAGVINTAIAFAQELVHRFHFDSFGRFIGEGLRSAIENIDWAGLADTLATGINGIFDAIRGFNDAMTSINAETGLTGWETFGNNIRDGIIDAVTSIKWEENGEALGEVIHNLIDALMTFLNSDTMGDLIEGIKTFVKQLPWDEIADLAMELFFLQLQLKFTVYLAMLEGSVSPEIKGADISGRNAALDFANGYKTGLGEQKEPVRETAQESLVDPVVSAIQESDLSGIEQFPEKVVSKVQEHSDVLRTGGQNLVDETTQPFAEADTSEEMNAFTQNLKTNLETSLANTPMDESSRIILESLVGALEAGSEDIVGVTNAIMETVKETILMNIEVIKTEVTTILTEGFTEMMTTWWETQLLPWFLPEKWIAEIITPIDTAIKTKWTEFVTWWDTSMKDWWNNSVKPYFEQKKWEELFGNVKKAADSVFPTVREVIETEINTAKDTVVVACQEMTSALSGVISKLGELKSNIAGLEAMGTFNFSASFPHLAQGAVIPPNKEFLAVLGDQKSGTNIEAPLDTIVDAFRSVVGNMQVQNSGYSTMELDGETFARLITPYVVSELNRQGYNVDVLEA